MTPRLLAFPGCAPLARSVCEGLAATSGSIAWRHFPDGESLVALEGDCAGRDVVVVATLRDPDRLALPLLFAARTARELGARSVGLVAPYLAYLRQDARFKPGEAVSAVHFGAFLSWTFDWLVTVDPHLHRQHDLGALLTIPAVAVSATGPVAAWIAANVADPVLVGPDEESAQWLEPLAKAAGAPVVVLAKERRGDYDVRVGPPQADLAGRTMIEAIARLREARARAPICLAVHGLFAGDAEQRLRLAGAAAVATANTIEHPTNAIDVAPVLVEALAPRLRIAPA